MNPISVGAFATVSTAHAPPRSCGQLLGHGGPLPVTVAGQWRLFPLVPSVVIIAPYSHTCEHMLYTAKQSALFVLCQQLSLHFFLGRFFSKESRPTFLWSPVGRNHRPEMMITRRALPWGDSKKVHILYLKASLWFLHFKVWYKTNMPARDYATPPLPSTPPFHTCCSHHWE